MKKIGSFAALLVLSFLLYLVLTGSTEPDSLYLGAVAALAVSAALLRWIYFPIRYLNPLRIARLVLYLPFFFLEMIKANLRIALIVLDPGLPIHPEIKSGSTDLKSGYGRLLLANSITLTPGTLTVDLNEDEYQIHCVSNPASAREIMEPFEKRIRRITE
jgi:multicomponent Na+:H+ antiporter subunit E